MSDSDSTDSLHTLGAAAAAQAVGKVAHTHYAAAYTASHAAAAPASEPASPPHKAPPQRCAAPPVSYKALCVSATSALGCLAVADGRSCLFPVSSSTARRRRRGSI